MLPWKHKEERTNEASHARRGICLFAFSAFAQTTTFHAQMNGAQEVPPNDSKGTGTATVTLSGNTVTYDVSYSGLTGPATAAHIHGPAAPGANAGVVIPFQNASTTPIKGTATVTDAQKADMMAGKYYANIHTAAHGGGEIRGQLMPAQ